MIPTWSTPDEYSDSVGQSLKKYQKLLELAKISSRE